MAETHSTVEYRNILGFPGYRVGDDGSVWTLWKSKSLGYGGGWTSVMRHPWRKMKATKPDKRHYSHVILRRDGKSFIRSVHQLVLDMFRGPNPDRLDSRHLDDDRSNNSLSNLERGTRKQNMADARRNGKALDGEKNGMAVLTVTDVRRIRSLLADGMRKCDVAILTGFNYSTVNNIHRGSRWQNVE